MRNLNLTLVSLGTVLLMAGCGGGGSSGGTTNTTIPTAAVQITSSNAQTVAAGANTAAQTTASQGGSSATAVVGVVTQPTGHLPSVLEIATSQFKRGLALPIPATTVAGAITTNTVNCTSGGSVTLTYSMAGSTFAQGDSFTITHNNCVDPSGTTNGSMNFAVTILTGGLGTPGSTATFTVTFSNFSSTLGTESIAMNGDMSISATSSGNTTTSTISGNSFTMTSSVGGASESFQLTNYNETYSFNDVTLEYSYSSDMTLAATGMGGSVTIDTTQPFTGTGGNPTAGSMTITGAGGSYLTLTANANGTDVTLSGNDGTASFGPTVVAWTAL